MTITHLDHFLKVVTDSRETKRALAVKMALLGMPFASLTRASNSFQF